jgi:8-oxo-dGTP pyrophosphatase MutT (NUDIX family)
VVPLRDGPDGIEVLLLRRSSGSGAFGGMWVFPGGQIDPEDSVGTGADTGELGVARRAAVREAAEEAGIDLQEDSLVFLSFWLPPPGVGRRFATWFFLAPAHQHGQVVVDRREIHEHRWVTPRRAMELRDSGEIGLVPPTFATLWWVAGQRDTSSALAAARARVPERFETHLVTGSDGVPRAGVWAGDVAYDDGDLDRPGPRRRLVMDDPAGWRLEVSP